MIKKLLKNRFFQITASILLLVGLVSKTNLLNDLKNNVSSTAQAVGDLLIDWGVPAGNPIFTVNNFLPGFTEIRTVKVTNEGPVSLPLAARGIVTEEEGDLASALELTILENGTDIYGGASGTGVKTLADFFTESAGPEGLGFSLIDSGQTKDYTFKVNFLSSSGNQFQGGKVVFDIIIGIAIKIPVECQGITFNGSTIYGTSGKDNINGTNDNDLIFGFGDEDYLVGIGGDDCLVGGYGDDHLVGGAGNDVLLGDENNDFLIGNNGDDILVGGDGYDDLNGNNGTDTCDGEVKTDCEL